MKWNDFAQEVHQNAVDHGWWEPKPSFAQIVVMCHSELSEAVEEYRCGRPMVYRMCEVSGKVPCDLDVTGVCAFAPGDPCKYRGAKPEGVAVEMGDCILRILDVLAEENVDIDDNLAPGLGYHPGDLVAVIAKCHTLISKTYLYSRTHNWCAYLLDCVETILAWAAQNDVDMEAVLRAKHAYNKTRPYRHGGKAL